MKTTTTIATTIVVELTPTDIQAYAIAKNLVPQGWQYYSLELIGKGPSNGATLTLKHSAIKEPEA